MLSEKADGKMAKAGLITNQEQMNMNYEYFINLYERGEFSADVRDTNSITVYNIKGFDIFEDGFMQHTDDVDGLYTHLIDIGTLRAGDSLSSSQAA